MGKENDKKTVTWRNFIWPLTTIMAILTFAFFAPLETISTDKGEIKCSVLEILKLQGQYGTAEAIIYFVVGWILAFIIDKHFAQKFLYLFSKENRAAKLKAKREYAEEKELSKRAKNGDIDEDKD